MGYTRAAHPPTHRQASKEGNGSSAYGWMDKWCRGVCVQCREVGRKQTVALAERSRAQNGCPRQLNDSEGRNGCSSRSAREGR